MKRFMMILLFVLSLSTGLFAAELKIVYEPWLPSVGEYNAEEQGYAIEITKMIFSNDKLDFESLPYVRAIQQVETGASDVLLGVCDFEIDKTKVVFPKEIIGMIHPTFFVRDDSKWQYKGADSLKGIKLGLMHGYDYVEFESLADKSNFEYISGDDRIIRALKMLIMGRFSAMYEDKTVVRYYAGKIGIADKIREAGTVLEPIAFQVAFSLKHPDAGKLADEFDAEFQKMRASGQIGKILQKYGLTDWK